MRLWSLLPVLAALLATTPMAAIQPSPQAMRFGLRVGPEGWSGLADTLASAPSDTANPVGVTLALPAGWDDGADWQAFGAAATAVAASGARLEISVALAGSPESEESRAYLGKVSEVCGPASALDLQLSWEEFPRELRDDPDRLAFTLKSLISALRGGRSGTPVHLGSVTPEVLPLLPGLFERDLRAYVDGYSAPGAADGSPDGAAVKFLRDHHPGAPLWLHLPRVSTPLGAQLVVLVAAYRDATFVDLETDHPAEIWKALADLRAQLPTSTGPGFAARTVALSGAQGPRDDLGVIHLLDGETLRQCLVIVPTRQGSVRETISVTVPTEDVADPVAYPLPSGPPVQLGAHSDAAAHQTRMAVPFEGRPVLVGFGRLKTGTVGRDDLAVSQTYRIPVEVLLARHQGVQLAQDMALENYRCGARVDYHFKLPGSTGSVDLTFLNTFFFERGRGSRWVQDQLLLNGVAWKGKRIPELPVIEPEKVNVLPLALTLGRDYSYRYIRDEMVEGVPCHLVEFVPSAGLSGSFYTGKVWIEKGTYLKRRMSVRQTGLQEPQISNEETDEYRDFPGPGGRTYRLLATVSGQTIFSLAGRNILAERTIAFDAPEVNGEGFREEVAQAEASDKLILQDTEKGLRYLTKEDDGTRKLEMEPDTHRALAVGGVYSDPSLRYPLPLLGFAYVDYAWKGPKSQLSLFVTGVANTLNVSKVNLWPKVDGRLDAVLILIPLEDKFYVAGEEWEGARVKVLREIASAGLGWRPWEFLKFSAGLDLAYYRYSKASTTSPLFTLPSSHADVAVTASAEFARRGWSLDADASLHRRSTWRPWGMKPSAEAAHQATNYSRWNASLSKSFYLPKFQKIALSAAYLDGRDLDRFSRHSFTYLGRLKMAGFAGSGVRFDRGGILHATYEFNLAEVIRFSLQADAGRVQPDRGAGLWQDHTGVGISGSIVGPWRTYWTLDVGYAARSSIPAVRGSTTAALMVMKFW